MRYTTLQLVNKVLNGLNLQPVSTLGETEDAEQVLEIIDRAVTGIDLEINWFPRRTTVKLSTSTGSAYDLTTGNWKDAYPDIPWTMAIPTGVEAVYKVYYNNKPLTYVKPEEFLHRVTRGIAFLSTQAPRIWTSGLMDENYILMDSFDSTVESYLSASNSLVYCTQYPQTEPSQDTDVPGMSDKFYNYLINMALSLGQNELKGNLNLGASYERKAMRAYMQLLAQNDRTGQHKVSLGDINFARRRTRTIEIFDDEYKQGV